MNGISQYIKRFRNNNMSTYSRWYSLFGIVVTSVAVANFVFSVFSIGLAPVVAQLIDTYRAIVHGALDWLTWTLGFKLYGPVKDAVFIYGIFGGSFMRSRLDEGIYQDREHSLYDALRILVVPSKRLRNGGIPMVSRVSAMYQLAPQWLQMAMDVVLWPRVAKQYFVRPMVYFAEYSATYQTFKAGYVPGPRKTFLHDRRSILYVQLSLLLGAVAAILIVNGFLTIPSKPSGL